MPCVSHTSPENYAQLKVILSDPTQAFNWLAYISLLKFSPTELSEKDGALVVRALKHGEEEVRITAFAILIHSRKKTEPVRQQWVDSLEQRFYYHYHLKIYLYHYYYF